MGPSSWPLILSPPSLLVLARLSVTVGVGLEVNKGWVCGDMGHKEHLAIGDAVGDTQRGQNMEHGSCNQLLLGLKSDFSGVHAWVVTMGGRRWGIWIQSGIHAGMRLKRVDSQYESRVLQQ